MVAVGVADGEMSEHPLDDLGSVDARDDAQRAATHTMMLDVDVDDAPEPLHLAHGRRWRRKRLAGGWISTAKAWAAGDRPSAERAVTDEMIAATSIAGTPAGRRGRIEDCRASGLELPIISPLARGPGARDRLLAAIETCAP